MKMVTLAAFLSFFLPTAVPAQLDPELDKPYRLQVVLLIAENRFLTPLFQEQLQRALQDDLRMRLGALAEVEIVRNHPLLKEIETKGLEYGIDGWRLFSGLKTHFLLVDFVHGTYELKARQYDGSTGLLSPAVRTTQIGDRNLVAGAAARIIEQDFGLVGTVTQVDRDVQLALKGGNLETKWERWVKPGDVFAISRITRENDKERATLVPWALLEVLDGPRAGNCRCKLWHRFQEDDLKERPGILGYRCLKLTTTSGPLHLRFLDDESRPLSFLQVHVLKPGASQAAELTTNRDGLVVTRSSYPHLALVRVLAGDAVRAQFPVAITGDDTVVCRLKIQPDGESLAPLEFRKDQWFRRILDNARLASERVADLNRELNISMDKTLDAARQGLKSMDSEIRDLTQEHDEILRQAKDKMAQLDLRDGDLALHALEKKKKDLELFVSRIDAALKESKNATKLGLAKTLERARLYEGEAEFDKAIALYAQVLEASPDQGKVKEHLAKLKKEWEPKDAKHAEARAFLIGTWPKLEVLELQKNLGKAREALALCGDAKDRFTPLKVMQADVVHAANLKKYFDTLRSRESVDNRTQMQTIAQVIQGLSRLNADATALSQRKKE